MSKRPVQDLYCRESPQKRICSNSHSVRGTNTGNSSNNEDNQNQHTLLTTSPFPTYIHNPHHPRHTRGPHSELHTYSHLSQRHSPAVPILSSPFNPTTSQIFGVNQFDNSIDNRCSNSGSNRRRHDNNNQSYNNFSDHNNNDQDINNCNIGTSNVNKKNHLILSNNYRQSNKNHGFNFLPPQLIYQIFLFLNKAELIHMGQVCRIWWQSSRQNLLWRSLDLEQETTKMSNRTYFKVENFLQVVSLVQQIFTPPHVKVKYGSSLHENHAHPYKALVPVRVLTLPSCCTHITHSGFQKLRESCPELEEVIFPPVSASSDTPYAVQSIDDQILRELSYIYTLKRLNLTTHHLITDCGLNHIAQGCPNLTHLVLDHCRGVTSSSIIEIMKNNSQKLKILSAKHCASCSFSSQDLKLLSDYCSHIEELSITLQPNVEADAVAIFASKANHLKILNLNGWKKLDGYALSKLSSQLNSIEKISISASESTRIIAPIISSDTLQELNISKCDHLSSAVFRCASLRKLQFENLGIQDIEFEHAPLLSDLRLKTCRIANYHQVQSQIMSLEKLRFLEFFDCFGISTVDLKSNSLLELVFFMCQDLVDLSVRAPQLKLINVDVCMQLSRAQVRAENLEKCEWFKLIQTQSPAMHQFEIESKKLQALSLQRCVNLQKVSVAAEKMKSLNLSECKLLETLALNCPTLEALALSAPRMNFTPHYAQTIIQNCPSVKKLSISNIPTLSDEAFEHLLSGWRELQAIIVSNCEGLRDPEIHASHLKGIQISDCTRLHRLLISCPQLNKLFIKNAPNLDDDFLKSLKDNAPRLQSIVLTACHGLKEPKFAADLLKIIQVSDCNNLCKASILAPKLQECSFKTCPQLKFTNFVPEVLRPIQPSHAPSPYHSISQSLSQPLQFQSNHQQQQQHHHQHHQQQQQQHAQLIQSFQQQPPQHQQLPFPSSLIPPFQHQSWQQMQHRSQQQQQQLPSSFSSSLGSSFHYSQSTSIPVSAPQLPLVPHYHQNHSSQFSHSSKIPSMNTSSPAQSSFLPPPIIPLRQQQQSSHGALPNLSFFELVNCGVEHCNISINTQRVNISECNKMRVLKINSPVMQKGIVSDCPNLTQLYITGSGATEFIVMSCPSLKSTGLRSSRVQNLRIKT